MSFHYGPQDLSFKLKDIFAKVNFMTKEILSNYFINYRGNLANNLARDQINVGFAMKILPKKDVVYLYLVHIINPKNFSHHLFFFNLENQEKNYPT